MNGTSARSAPSAAEHAQPEGSETLRLLPVVVPVTAAGIAVLGAAVWSLMTSTPSLGSFAGLLALQTQRLTGRRGDIIGVLLEKRS